MIPNPERDPSPRRRGRVIGAWALGVAAVLAIAVVAVVVTRPGSHQTVVVGQAPTSTTTDPTHAFDCKVPALRAASGPAPTALRGGAAVSSFALDDGQFALAVPPPGQTPSVTAVQAECAALASTGPNGGSIGVSAESGGVAIGYGLVTIAPHVGSSMPLGVEGGPDAATNPRLPAPASFAARPAWVVVVEDSLLSNCPAIPAVPPTSVPTASVPTATEPANYGYVVFVLDARTGSDALLYREGAPAPCGGSVWQPPSVSVPAENVSVPWTLVSRAADRYTGTISIAVLPCDGHPGVASIDRDHPAVQVVVQRPFGAACGRSTAVNIPLHAAIVTADLPARIDHDPVGLVINPWAGNQVVGATPGATSGVLRQLQPAIPAAGTTVRLHVDDVVFLPDAYTGDNLNILPATSSDPAVFGLLDGSRNEYRAWTPGRAEVTLASTFEPPGAAPQVVHVVVTP